MNNKADKVAGVYYIEGNSTEAGVWTGQHEDITEYYPGLMITYKTNIAGVSGGSTLNINSLGTVPVVRNVNNAVTTTYSVGCILNLTYTVDDGVAYWKIADYDVNTKNSAGTSNKTGSKMYIVGATSQTSSGTTTYTNTNCFIGTDNKLYSGGNKVVDTNELEAKGYLTEHQDISGKADKTELNSLTLGVHTDGLIYLFKNGQPIGNGVSQSTQGGDVVGYVDSENNIVLSGKLADGAYSLKYEFEDGHQVVIGNFSIGGKTSVNVMEEGEIHLNKRFSKSSASLVDKQGAFTVIVPFENDGTSSYILKFKNLKMTIKTSQNVLYLLDSNKLNPQIVNGNGEFLLMTGGVVESSDKTSAEVTFTPPASSKYLAIGIIVNTSSSITIEDFKNYIITLEKKQ